MSLLVILTVAFVLVAGGASSLQGAANAGLASRIGLGTALLVNAVVVFVGAAALWLAEGAKTTFVARGASPVHYAGGLCGIVILAAAALAFPKIGASRAIAVLVLGQCLVAVALDHFGVLGLPRDPVTARRAIGIGLVVVGVAVLRW